MREETIGSEQIFNGRIINVRVDKVMLPNGRTSTREIVEHPGAVAIVAVTKEQELLFVKQYRKPVDEILLEIPAGKLEKGEDPAVCAARELAEETGYKPESLRFLYEFYTSAGFSNEKMYLYLAEGVTPAAANPDEDEFIEVEKVKLKDLPALLVSGRIRDAKSLIGVLHLLKR